MIICPLCEHIQERGTVCDVCGKTFVGPGVIAEPIAPLPGLDTGRMGDVDLTGRYSSDEPEHSDEAISPPRESLSLEDLASQLFSDQAAPQAAAPQQMTRCRACGQVQAAGDVTCEKCGSRLPRFLSETADGDDGEEAGPVLCRQCGVKAVPAGGLCPACGARHSTEI